MADCRIWALLKRTDVGHLPFGGLGNPIRIGLEQDQPQQMVVVGRTLRFAYSKPLEIGIKPVRHGSRLDIRLQGYGQAARGEATA